MDCSQAKEAMRTFSYNAKDFSEGEGNTYNVNHTEKGVQVEIQAIADNSLNTVLLGLSGSLDPQPRYVGLTLGDIPLTNVSGDFSAEHDLTAHPLHGNHNHSSADVPFPVRVPHGLDENNQVTMQDLQIIHQSEKQQQLRNFHQSAEQQRQQLQIFHQSLDQQQHHPQIFHQSAEQHHQQLLNAESGTVGHDLNHDQTLERHKGRNFSYGGIDHKGAGFQLATAWEESVKYLENLRQLQEQHAQQPPLLQQPKGDQFYLNNMASGVGAGAQSISGFGEFDPVHQENAFPRDKLPANHMQSDFYNLPQPSRLSISTSTSCTAVLGFPGSSGSVHSPGPTNRRPSGPVNSCHSPGANPFGYELNDRNSSSHFFGTNDNQPPPPIPYVGLTNKLLSYNSVPAGNSGAFSKFFCNFSNTAAPAGASTCTGPGPPFPVVDLPINCKPPAYSSVEQELHLDYGHRNESRDVFGAPAVSHGHFLQEIPRRSKSAAGRLLGELEPKPLHHFATERQRREHLNEKYQTLRSLVPNPTKADRASIVSDAINRIHELKKEEEALLSDKKDKERRKNVRHEMRNNGKRPRLDGSEMDQRDEGEDVTLKTQWLRKVSKHGTEVEVRILCDEVEVNIKQTHTPKFLVRVMTAIELGLKLRVLDGNGGVIKNRDIYRFRLKMKGDSCTFIGLIATKMIEILDAVF